jgi:diguanylate cyclase (GGDEF)-like protein
VTTSGTSAQDALDWVDALVDLARSARQDQLADVLLTVCDTIRRITDFQNVVFNLYRPAWDDFEVVIVIGSDEARETLLGSFKSRQTCEAELFRPEFEEAPGVFLVPGEAAAWDRVGISYTPDVVPEDGEMSWANEDGLLVRLEDSRSGTLGFLSIDEPRSGRRPNREAYRLLRAVCSHAEQVLESSQASANLAKTAAKGEALIRAADRFAKCPDERAVLTALANFGPAVGFDRAAAYLAVDGRLELACSVGFPLDAPIEVSLPETRADQLLKTGEDRAGTYVVERATLHGQSTKEVSAHNGVGPAAWHEHAVLVPARDASGALHALLSLEDPTDRLLPDPSGLRVLRILVDRAASALEAVVARQQLAHLATHDALTGLRNRRALDDRECRPEQPGGVLLCDLDHFKQINDTYGHALGDAVLARFADVLRIATRQGDIVVRLGGEEFVVLLGAVDQGATVTIAQRIVAATATAFDDLVETPVTVSIGAVLLGEADLYAAIDLADAALYEAKSTGRNCVVFGDPPL